MARAIRNAKLDTRSARTKCEVRREPHWQKISKGCYIGYRRSSDGGTWIARLRDEHGAQHYEALGAADDHREADALTVFSFAQAQERARAFFERRARELAGHEEPQAGPYTVRTAIDDYLAHRRRRGSKGVSADTSSANSRILPELGDIEVSKLTARRIERWQDALASAPRLVRSKKLAMERRTRAVDASDPDAVRKRRATANRVLTVLKAALNFAYSRGRVASDDAWRRVKPYREVEEARIRYLSAEECRRIVNACGADFRRLVQGALATGARYGELIRLRVADFNVEAATVSVQISKSGKARHIALADEGRDLFAELVTGKTGSELIFKRDDGDAWGKSHQARPLIDASTIAKIEPAATFHILRHTYASALAMRGVPVGVIAAQLGHSDTRMTEKHYAHLAPSYVAETIRASLPPLAGFVKSNVAALRRDS